MSILEYKYTIHTDGAAAGNPGNIGIGVYIAQHDPEDTLCLISEAIGFGTNNEAEYAAVVKALRIVTDFDLYPVLICSDSLLVINQILGKYKVESSNLAKHYAAVMKFLNKAEGKIVFQWVPRENNAIADALASKSVGMPQAIVRNNKVLFWSNNEKGEKGDISNLPKANPECEKQINNILAKGESAKFKDYANLKTGGCDSYSKASEGMLKSHVKSRYGAEAMEWILVSTMDAHKDYYLNSLRWCARGLTPPQALKKVSVDMEVAANRSKALYS